MPLLLTNRPRRCAGILSATAAVLFSGWLTSCTQVPPEQDADVIVVGAGIAGLAAALQASAEGARVLVIDTNSVAGGHAVKAGGFALVDTALQRSKGIKDSPDLAFRDLYNWGKEPDVYWTRRYVDTSATEVYDWLTDMGVEFKMVLKTPEDTVPRFHFTRGTAVNAIIPMFRKALLDPDIRFVWNTRVTALARTQGKISGVFSVNERDGSKRQWRAPNTVLATGGFQNNLTMVRDNWPSDRNKPQRLFRGAGHFATGDGYRLAGWAGADLKNMDRQVTFYSGVPDPDASAGDQALYSENPAAIWVASNGRRFVDESADSKVVEAAVNELKPMSYWLIFDEPGSRKLNVRDALAPNRIPVRDAILADPKTTITANNIDELARQAGLPAHGLRTSIETWNRMVEIGEDFQFGRFDHKRHPGKIAMIAQPPYYALRVYPLTRKSMGGPAIDRNAQVVDVAGTPIPGLYAAGELTGVGGINGLYGGSGTFLGPSVLLGRLAGKSAGQNSLQTTRAIRYWKLPAATAPAATAPPPFGQPGYWHYDAVHRLVADKGFSCDRCHSVSTPKRMADVPNDMLARLRTCVSCH